MSAPAAAAVPFRDFMAHSLHGRGGFYSRRRPGADFYTAPELTPAFAEILAGEFARRFDALRRQGIRGPYALVEMGSGTGLLARQVAAALSRLRPDLFSSLRFILVEPQRQLLLDSVLSLSAATPHVLGYSRLEDVLPCAGVFHSNELVDALPFHLLETTPEGAREVYIRGDVPVLGPLSSPALEGPARTLDGLPPGQRHAVGLEALRWLGTVARKLTAGAVVTVDYGSRLPPGAINPPRTFRRHRVETEGSELGLGGRDITANVDFEALIGEGRRLGLGLDRYSTLAGFLIDGGIGALVEAAPPPERLRVKTLLHPDGMGESFKVLIQTKGAATEGI